MSPAALLSFDETGRADGRGQGMVLELIYEHVARGGMCVRELVVYRFLQGYAVLFGRGGVKTIDNPPDPTPGWKSRFFFAQLLSKRDIWGIPKRRVEPLSDPIFESEAGFAASQQLTLMYLRGICESSTRLVAAVLVPSLPEVERRKECSRKRVCSLVEGSSPADPGLSVEGFSKLSPIGGTSPVILRDGRRVVLPHEQVAPSESRKPEPLSKREATLSEVVRLWKKLEVSRTEMVCLQALLQEGDVQSSVVVEYLQRDIFHYREKFEHTHYS
ncbi:hypothetical protein ACLOJK_037465 [Asimina triloba]